MDNQKLAPGSEWIVDDQILDCEKCTHFISNGEIVVCDQMGNIDVADAIALIDRAGLDPVRVAARKLVELAEKPNMEKTLRLFEFQCAIEELKAVL